MKIKIAVIPNEYIVDAQNLSLKLQEAIVKGEMKVVDQTTEKLLLLADKDASLSLSEERWHLLIKQVRSFDENFKSDYIMTKSQLKTIISAGVVESLADTISVIEHALKTESLVLQLPYEEEDGNV